MSDVWNTPIGIALGFAAGLLGVYLVALPLWWWDRRDRWRWQAAGGRTVVPVGPGTPTLDDGGGVREEQLSDEERPWRQAYLAREAAIRHEARRRLGLPEEDPPC